MVKKSILLLLLLITISGVGFAQFHRKSVSDTISSATDLTATSYPAEPVYVGSNYMPMHLGNSYQYLQYQGNNKYSLNLEKIEQSTVINKKEYFHFKYSWLRYSEEDRKLYSFTDTERVHMDFNKAPGQIFYRYSPSPINNWWEALVHGGTKIVFTDQWQYKGYSITNQGYFTPKQSETYAENFGLIHSWDTGEIISALLYDSLGNKHYYSKHHKPKITIKPITKINSRTFYLTVKVDHEYNRYSSIGDLIFIDTVFFESYYSNGESIIPEPLRIASYLGNTEYGFSRMLDPFLMKIGYSFNYRIIAKDKTIVPEISYAPSNTGFYKCTWDPTAVADRYSLFQNYPNPFNPSTHIRYFIPYESNISIKVLNILGEIVREYNIGLKKSGVHEITFNADGLSSGIYFYSINALSTDGWDNYNQVKKMSFLK